MADIEGAGFWLPSEFLDDFLLEKQNIDNNNFPESDSEFCFPTEFPYDLATKSDDLLQLSQKRWVMSTSPQSTLSHMSSWTGRSPGGSTNGFYSPPTTPKNDAVDHLICLAAGQVAKLNLCGGDAAGPTTKPKGLLSPHRSLEQLYPSANAKPHDSSVIPNIYLQQQQMVKQQKQRYEMWPRMYEMRRGEDAWPVQPNPTRIVGSGGRAVVLASGGGGAAEKRGCAGTGVFLPRRYANANNNHCNAYASDSPNKSAASIPNRNAHGIHKNFDSLNGFAQFPPKLGGGYITEYDLFMARRNALFLQHRRGLLLESSSPMNRGSYQWTY